MKRSQTIYPSLLHSDTLGENSFFKTRFFFQQHVMFFSFRLLPLPSYNFVVVLLTPFTVSCVTSIRVEILRHLFFCLNEMRWCNTEQMKENKENSCYSRSVPVRYTYIVW